MPNFLLVMKKMLTILKKDAIASNENNTKKNKYKLLRTFLYAFLYQKITLRNNKFIKLYKLIFIEFVYFHSMIT